MDRAVAQDHIAKLKDIRMSWEYCSLPGAVDVSYLLTRTIRQIERCKEDLPDAPETGKVESGDQQQYPNGDGGG